MINVKKIKIHYTWGLLVINPVLCLIGNLISIIRGRAPSYFTITISIIIILSYFPIMWDVRSNFYRIYFFPEEGLNLYTYILSLLSTDIGFPYVVSVVSFAILIAYIYVLLLKRDLCDIQKNKSIFYFLLTFLFFLFLFEYRQLFDLQKTSLSIVFFILALEVKNKIIKIILFFLSISFHPLMILLSLMAFLSLSLRLKNKIHFIFLFAALFFSFFFIDIIVDIIINHFSFSERIVHYALISKSKFSSENIALLVKYLRIFSIISIFLIFRSYLIDKNIKLKNYSNLILYLSSLSILLSFNEIALERYYLALITLVIFVSIKFKLPFKKLATLFFFISINVYIHGFYTLGIIFSDNYEVYNNSDIKLDMVLKVVCYPTLMLLNYEAIGQSDDFYKNYTEIY